LPHGDALAIAAERSGIFRRFFQPFGLRSGLLARA
jgi:hypothetical protein